MEQMENLLNEFEEPQYTYAGFWPRLGALFIDGIILGATGYLLSILVIPDNLISITITALIPLLYHLILEYRFGATLGKMLLKIKIVNYNLQPLKISNVFLRNIIYIGLQIIQSGIELNNYFNLQSSDEMEFRTISDFFTPQIITGVAFTLLVIIIYFIEMLFLLNDPKCRALHDRIGKTYVVKNIA